MLVEHPTEMRTPHLQRRQRAQPAWTTTRSRRRTPTSTRAWRRAYCGDQPRQRGARPRAGHRHGHDAAQTASSARRSSSARCNYFNLVRLFGGVPLKHARDDWPRQPADAARSTTAETSTRRSCRICRTPSKVLPSAKPYGRRDIGRASRGAAKTLLAKVVYAARRRPAVALRPTISRR